MDSGNAADRWTAEDLVGRAQDQGTPISKRLLVDWVSLGLIDAPKRRGLGRSQGSIATWPEEQLELLLLLLQKRTEGTHISALCNIPVLLWLQWGDRYASTDQVRRAITTWSKDAPYANQRKARARWRELIKEISHPDASGDAKRLLVDELVRLSAARLVDLEALSRLMEPVIDPHGEGPRGPDGASLSARAWVQLIEARLRAIDAWGDLEEAALEQARIVYQQSRAGYMADLPRLRSNPDIGAFFEPATATEVANSACSDLVTIVGLLLNRSRDSTAT